MKQKQIHKGPKVVYKHKTATGATCEGCGKRCRNPYWIGFDYGGNIGVLEGPYGSNCAKKFKIGQHCR